MGFMFLCRRIQSASTTSCAHNGVLTKRSEAPNIDHEAFYGSLQQQGGGQDRQQAFASQNLLSYPGVLISLSNLMSGLSKIQTRK
jgi:hypothetical protein